MFFRLKTWQLFLVSLVATALVMYPSITWLPWELSRLVGEAKLYKWISFVSQVGLLVLLFYFLISYNFKSIANYPFWKRFLINFAVSLFSFFIYGVAFYLLDTRVIHYGSLVLFQFFLASVICTLLGHITMLYMETRKKEQEIEELRVQNLKSSYDALTNQINPHFFFNSLQGLASLIRKKDEQVTLTYLEKLSDVFRYILQSNQKGIVSLGEELAFVDAFRYMMEVRFADKLRYIIDIDNQYMSLQLPVLSILPILDNIVVHNTVDSDHKMTIHISINEEKELVISNPIFPKLIKADTNGTGLANLESRFRLLMNRSIRYYSDDVHFTVILPLK